MDAKRSVQEEGLLLAAERSAILAVLEEVFKRYHVPIAERADRVALACVSLGAEAWGRLYAMLSQDECASLYGDVAREALRGWHDANVFTFSMSDNAKGKLNV